MFTRWTSTLARKDGALHSCYLSLGDFAERQQLLRLVVVLINVANDVVLVETVIPTGQDDHTLHYARREFAEP